MEIFSKNIVVTADDLDDLDHVNNVTYVAWIQEISRDHWLSVAPPGLVKNMVWVVRSHHIFYKSPAVLHDAILLKTFIAETKGPLSERIVEMYRADTGDLLVHSRTSWCLLNATSLKPMRITADISRLFIPST